jgi:hypothetical protein
MLFRRVQTGIEKLQKKASEGNIPSPLLCKKEFYLGKFEGGLINKCRALCVVQRERERECVCVCEFIYPDPSKRYAGYKVRSQGS